MAQLPGQPTSFEFNAEQDKTISGVAHALKAAGFFFLIYGAIMLLTSFDHLQAKQWMEWAKTVVDGVLFMVTGSWLRNGSRSLLEVTTTQGDDIPKLMVGLDAIGRVFRLWCYAMLTMCLLQLAYAGLYFVARHFNVHLPGA